MQVSELWRISRRKRNRGHDMWRAGRVTETQVTVSRRKGKLETQAIWKGVSEAWCCNVSVVERFILVSGPGYLETDVALLQQCGQIICFAFSINMSLWMSTGRDLEIKQKKNFSMSIKGLIYHQLFNQMKMICFLKRLFAEQMFQKCNRLLQLLYPL